MGCFITKYFILDNRFYSDTKTQKKLSKSLNLALKVFWFLSRKTLRNPNRLIFFSCPTMHPFYLDKKDNTYIYCIRDQTSQFSRFYHSKEDKREKYKRRNFKDYKQILLFFYILQTLLFISIVFTLIHRINVMIYAKK